MATESRHDVIIVGARCAGATLATFLARGGASVLLLDKDRLPSDQTNAYEVKIFDKRPDQSYRTGGIVDVANPPASSRRAGSGIPTTSRPKARS